MVRVGWFINQYLNTGQITERCFNFAPDDGPVFGIQPMATCPPSTKCFA